MAAPAGNLRDQQISGRPNPLNDPFLGGGGPPQQMRMPRIRSPGPGDYKFTIDIPYDTQADINEAKR